MKMRLSIILAVTLALVGFSGCTNAESAQKVEMEAMMTESVKEAPVEASPQQAVVAVIKEIEQRDGGCSAKEMSDAEFTAATDITNEEYIEFVAYSSEAQEGLSNIFIVKPYPSLREDVRAKLLGYREVRMREFENFDILDSYSISKNAVVYDQGEYLVMLMVKDNGSAQAQIDKYIPQ